MEKIAADASPEKRLFISLITRDISLIDAFLDIIDNSINAALEPLASKLKTADDYQRLLSNKQLKPKVKIKITIGPSKIVVSDNAHGISLKMAKDHVFKFGRGEADTDPSDRLSVYGIGLKRAMFKCGNKIEIISDHRQGGFELRLDVREWAKLNEVPWKFEIVPRPVATKNFNTRITISDLHDDVLRRLGDGLFIKQLRDKVSETYSVFIGSVVEIELESIPISKESFEIGTNYASAQFKSGKVSCSITAGIASSSGKGFRDKNAGWFVFCNGRAVLSADKTNLTGWGGAGLPIFQPKHRPFLGTVFFVSSDPEALPWTTTKGSVNEEDMVWQEAKRHMILVGRVIVDFLDKRYTGDGTEIASAELQDASGGRVSVLSAAVAKPRKFKSPTKPVPKTRKIQYEARIDDVDQIKSYVRKPGMSDSEVGRYTFNYFLNNIVTDNE